VRSTDAARGDENVLLYHGAGGPFYGVNVEDLKSIQKRIKS